jgi:uncharacterized membrane protein
MDALVGYVLLIGVVLSVALVAAGLVWRWLRTGQVGIEYQLAPQNLAEFLAGEIRHVVGGEFRPRLLVSLGITTLLLTPYLRVLASLLFFTLAEHNWKYSAFTGFVLAVLTYSLFLR